MKQAATTPAATPPIVPPMTAGVWSLPAEPAAGVGTTVEELVGESGAAVMTIMLTTVEAWPAEFEVMEVKVWVDGSSATVALVVTLTVA